MGDCERDERWHALDGKTEWGDSVFHSRYQFLAKFDGEVLESLLSLVKVCLHGIVLYVELVNDTRASCVWLGGEVLCGLHLVEVRSHGREYAHGTSTVELHFLKHWCHLSEATLGLHSLHELHQALVGICLHEVGELCDFHTCNLGKFGWLLIHLGDELWKDSGGSSLLLHILVEGGGETHELCLGHASLNADTREVGSEIDDIASVGWWVLGKLVDCGASGKHRTTQALGLILTKHLS